MAEPLLLDPAALHAARQWAETHDHQQPDDRMLAAYGQVIAVRAAEAERERIADAITDNVRNPDFSKQDRGGWHGFSEAMAYVAGHDKAAAIARTAGTTEADR